TISQPSGSWNSSINPVRTSPTRFLTGACRCDVPSTDREALTTASICSARTLDGPHPKRPSTGRSSRGIDNSLGATPVTDLALQPIVPVTPCCQPAAHHPCCHPAHHPCSHPAHHPCSHPAHHPCSHPAPEPLMKRVSARLAAIAESATLAVDA